VVRYGGENNDELCQGKFIWGGKNVIENTSGYAINIKEGANVYLINGFELVAGSYTAPVATLSIANIAGNLHFKQYNATIKTNLSFVSTAQLHFYLDATKINNLKYSSTVTTNSANSIVKLLEDSTLNLSGVSHIFFKFESGFDLFNIGDMITLMKVSTGSISGADSLISNAIFVNVLDEVPNDLYMTNIGYEIELSLMDEDKSLVALVVDKSVTIYYNKLNLKIKHFTEGVMVNLAILSEISSNISNLTLNTDDFSFFMSSDYSNSKYKTGDYIDLNGVKSIIGFGSNFNALKVAAFTELGFYSYGAHNDYSYFEVSGDNYINFSKGKIDGNGKSNYIGGGLIVFYSLFNDSLYFEFAGHGGQILNNLTTNWNDYNYDYKTNYFGYHAGLGYIYYTDDEESEVNFYAKYINSTLFGKKTKIKNGDNEEILNNEDETIYLEFKDSISQKISIGVRYTTGIGYFFALFDIYVGVNYEGEINGKIKSKIDYEDVDSQTLKGDTYKAELGLSIKQKGWEIEGGIEAYTGIRDGYAARAKIKFDW
jgi:hypothetical protein